MSTTPGAPSWPTRVVVLGGAGLVGSGLAHLLAVTGTCAEVVLVDRHRDVALAHAIDIGEAQLVAGDSTTTVTEMDVGEAPPADLVVVAASVAEVPDGDRRNFLAGNLDLLRALAPTVARLAGEHGVVLVLSNPVDVLTGALRHLTGLGAHRLLGYTLNDSLRFRIALSRELGVHPHRVEGWVLGEHGSGQVPLFSHVRLDDVPLALEPEARDRVRADADGWFARWSRLQPGRSSGWTTPAGSLRMVQAMAGSGVLPASVWTGDIDHLADCYLTLPARLGPRGVVTTEEWALDPVEADGLQRAATSVASAVDAALGEPRPTV